MGAMLGLSDLYLPFSSRVSPFAEEVVQATREVASRCGLLASPVAARRFEAFSTLGSHFFPEATPERLCACSLFVDWLFFVDDLCDGDGAVNDLGALRWQLEEQLAVLRGGAMPQHVTPLSAGTRAVRERLLPLFGVSRHARFCDVVEHYLIDGSLMATASRASRTVPDLDRYSRQREADGGSFTVIALIEVAHAIELPLSLSTHVEVLRLKRLCARILSFVNDVVSYQKEVLGQGSPNNLVRIFEEHAGQSFAQAVSTSIELINFLTMEFETLGVQVAARDPLLSRFVRGLEDLVMGNVRWSLDTGRYASSDSPFPELRAASGELLPLEPATGARGLRSLGGR